MNKKGFMMAELVVVSAIVLIFLSGLFISYNKIYTSYTKRLNYYNATTLYRLSFYEDYYFSQLATLKSQAQSSVVIINEIPNDNYNEQIFLIYNANQNLADTILNNETVNKTYKEYVSYLATAVDLTETPYVMLMERCKKIDTDDCKYAYLEVYDEA